MVWKDIPLRVSNLFRWSKVSEFTITSAVLPGAGSVQKSKWLWSVCRFLSREEVVAFNLPVLKTLNPS